MYPSVACSVLCFSSGVLQSGRPTLSRSGSPRMADEQPTDLVSVDRHMTRPSWEAEMTRETAQEQIKDDLFDKGLKHARGKLTRRRTSGLTCNEASVDNILSEGESI
jgi:hypothetical protein